MEYLIADLIPPESIGKQDCPGKTFTTASANGARVVSWFIFSMF